MSNFKFQGDIPFAPYTGEIKGKEFKHNGSVVLALGEKTGHKHVITVPDITDMDAYKCADGGWILTLRKEGTLTHNQHGALTIAPGTYRVGQEREHDYFAEVTRQVID
jgi:hypothetical protein